MVPFKLWIIIDVCLGLLILILGLSFLNFNFPSFGKALYFMNPEDPLCITNYQEHYTLLKDLNQCCFEAKKMLACTKEITQLEKGETNWVCQTGRGEVPKVRLNNKAYQYCLNLPFW